MSKINAPILQLRYYNFLKFKSLNRITSIFTFGLMNHIKLFFLKFNILLLTINIKYNNIYCYFYCFTKTNNCLRFKQKYSLFKKIIWINYTLNQFLFLAFIFFNTLNHFSKFKNLFFMLKYNFFYLYNNDKLLKSKQTIFTPIYFKISKLKNNLYLKNINMLLTFCLKKQYFFFNKSIFLKNVFSNKLLNTNWYISNTKQIFSFKNKLYSLLLISYLTEIFQMANIFLDYFLFFIKKNKLHIKKQLNLKVINQLKTYIFFLLSYNLIYFFGLCLYLTGKLTRSMRKAKMSIKYGNISTQSKKTHLSLSYNTVVTRSGIICFKLWLFF